MSWAGMTPTWLPLTAGLSSSIKLVEAWGGRVSVTSAVNQGTTVAVHMPRRPAPAWFCDRIAVAPGCSVYALDDDASMGHMWQERFSEAHLRARVILNTDRRIASFEAKVRDARGPFLCLVDHELLKEGESGLAVI